MLDENPDGIPAYDELKRMQLAGEPVEGSYSVREGEGREGKKSGGYKGKYLITSLELDGQAGDDSKYSVKLESCGPVEPIDGGIAGGDEGAAAAPSGEGGGAAVEIESYGGGED